MLRVQLILILERGMPKCFQLSYELVGVPLAVTIFA